MNELWQKVANWTVSLMLTLSMAVVLSGCEKKRSGPEKAAHKAGEAVEEAGEDIQKAADDARK